MEIGSGYKETEAGVIPEDWDLRLLRDLVDPVRTIRYGIVQPGRYDSSGRFMIRGQDYSQGWVPPSELFRVSAAVEEPFQNARVRAGDVLITIVGASTGRTAIVPDWLDGANLTQTTARIAPRADEVDGRYCSYVLASPVGARQVAKYLKGAAQPGLNCGDIEKFHFPLPGLPEQRAIAAALSDVDALLEGLTLLIAKKRDLKQAAMQQLLTGQTRLPGFHGEWEVKQLGAFGSTYGGLAGKSKEDFGGGQGRYITFMNVMSNVVIDCQRFDLVRIGPNESQNRVLRGDLLFNGSSETPEEVAMCSLLTQAVPELYLNSFCFGFRLREPASIDGLFLAYLVRSNVGREVMKSLAQGSTRYNLSKRSLLDATIRLPSLAEQSAIAAILSDMDAELSALEGRRGKTRALKQAMMQELLSGRTRLVQPAHATNEATKAPEHRRQANTHFVRSVLAAEIIDQLHEEPTFGHVKFEKVIFLVERMCGVETGSTYHRKAAGPYDNRALRSIDSQLRTQKWFEARKRSGRYEYAPLERRGGHKVYFDRYFATVKDSIERVLDTFKKVDTERCEIVATLLGAWEDLLRQEGQISDQRIVHEVLNNWHESKRRISEDRWLKALGWMRKEGIVPKGVAPR